MAVYEHLTMFAYLIKQNMSIIHRWSAEYLAKWICVTRPSSVHQRGAGRSRWVHYPTRMMPSWICMITSRFPIFHAKCTQPRALPWDELKSTGWSALSTCLSEDPAFIHTHAVANLSVILARIEPKRWGIGDICFRVKFGSILHLLRAEFPVLWSWRVLGKFSKRQSKQR